MIKYNKYVIDALKNSEKEAYEWNNGVVNIDCFILGILKSNNNVNALLEKYNITYESYINKLKKTDKKSEDIIYYSPDLKKILDLSYDTANRYSCKEIKLDHIFITLIDEDKGLKTIKSFNINIERFYKDLIKLASNNNDLLIDDLGIDFTELAKNNKLSNAIGREKEINDVIEILARKNKNNPILIGEAGVGKTAIVEELSNMIINNNVPDFLKNKKIISINIASIISGTKYRGEFEEKLTKILNECENEKNMILFIDEIHTIVGAGGAEGAIDASNILKPILARGTLKIIGATTITEYKKYISNDKALDRRFQKVYVKEPNINETYKILKTIKHEYEKFHNVKISDSLIRKIVELSDKYIIDRKNPDKSIDILDESCASTSIIRNSKSNSINNRLNKTISNKELSIRSGDYKSALNYKEKEELLKQKLYKSKKEVNIKTIISIIESKCNSSILDDESKNTYNLIKKNLNEVIIGQKDSIDKIVNSIEFLKSKKDNLPISFLITGYSGCGKSMFANELARIMNRNFIQLNMNEFSNELSINKILGSPQGYVGYNDNNMALEDLKIHPNSVILIDEIDKAHYTVINLIKRLLDDGFIKDSKNEIINFKNSIIIITITKNNDKNIGYIETKSISNKTIFEDFDCKVNYSLEFSKLNKNDIRKIIENQFNIIKENYNIDINLSEDDINKIINESSFETLGAKKISTILKNYIRDLITSNTL